MKNTKSDEDKHDAIVLRHRKRGKPPERSLIHWYVLFTPLTMISCIRHPRNEANTKETDIEETKTRQDNT